MMDINAGGIGGVSSGHRDRSLLVKPERKQGARDKEKERERDRARERSIESEREIKRERE